MRILLVDDEELFISALAERLEMRGIPADWVGSANAAIEKAGAVKYDMALLDVKMPNMGGIELKRRLKKIAPAMRFIFITGHGSQEDYETGSAEASSYLIKPLRIEVVVDKIHEVLNFKETKNV